MPLRARVIKTSSNENNDKAKKDGNPMSSKFK